MDIERVGKRGVLFTFHELHGFETNVYAISGRKHIFIADTFLGPEPMERVKEYMASNFSLKPFVVFNSHSHWDHIWGNCAFKEGMIISHEICREMIIKAGSDEKDRHSGCMMGNVVLTYPDVTFSESLTFSEDNVKFFHSPGHTEDSSSMLDMEDDVLFVGDNIESPIPYLNCSALDTYIKTLEGYLNMDADRIIAGHCHELDRRLIETNIEYIRRFRDGDTKKYETGACSDINEENMKVLGIKDK